ncbi:MAG: hypothetical protein WDN03_11385 [Rhizomicrobium sp.]
MTAFILFRANVNSFCGVDCDFLMKPCSKTILSPLIQNSTRAILSFSVDRAGSEPDGNAKESHRDFLRGHAADAPEMVRRRNH